ncbi:MAG: hypothetical protein JOZ65_01305 [Chloroflexi bacterium]|nr:hypothetical protein [Chloroflexota bacterium]
MTLANTSENTDTQHPDMQLTLSWIEAEHLRVTLPWMLQALADRPTAPERMRERRRKAHTILERLQTVLSGQLQQAQGG